MKQGPLGRLAADLRDRVASATAERRSELAWVWARRALRTNLAKAAGRGRFADDYSIPSLIGPLDSEADVRDALERVEEAIARFPAEDVRFGVGKHQQARSPEQLESLRARVLLQTVKEILDVLIGDFGVPDMRRLIWSVAWLADQAGCGIEEQQHMLREAGGAIDA
jgi:hypothetical protein